MATQVILLERVEKLGGMGDVVSVKPGYARNYLLPQNKALRASKENVAYFETQKKHLEAESEKGRKEAEKLAKKLSGIKVPLIRQASEAGQLYGSVTSRDIAAEVASVSKEAIGRDMVLLNQNFKSIGLFPVEIGLHPEVKVEVIINIARSGEEAEIQDKTGQALVSDAAEQAEEEAEAQLTRVEDVPSGLVRISVPTTYGHHRFLPLMPEFRRLYPNVEVEVEISNQSIDFVREGFDLAIRMGKLEDASFIARKLGDFSFGVFASPAYLKENGTPTAPTDLASHECGVFVMPRTGRNALWSFSQKPKTFAPKPAIRIRHDVLGLIAFARSGGGLIQMFHFLVEQELIRGELQEVLTDYSGGSQPFSLIYPKEVTARPAVQALIEYTIQSARKKTAPVGFKEDFQTK